MENTLNILFGKTSTELSQVIKGLTLEPYLKKSQKPKFQCLDLADGRTPEWLEGGQPTFHGVSWMPSIGEYPSAERESTLWEIIEMDVPLKYYLSPKACSGILRRAAKRGKELPKPLKEALERQAETPIEEILENAVPINCSQVYRICSYASNCMKSDNPNSGVYKTDINATLDLNGGNPACNQGGMCVVQGYILNDQGGDSLNVEQDDISPTLRAQAHGNEPIVCYALQGNMIGRQDQNGPKGSGISENLSYMLTASDVHAICYPIMLENHPNDSRIKIDESGNCQTLTSRMGTEGGNVPLCMVPIQAITQKNGFTVSSDVGNTLMSTDYKGVQCVAMPIIPINTQIAMRHNKLGERTGLGIGKEGDPSFTLLANHSHAVAVPIVYNGETIASPVNRQNPKAGDPCHTLDTDSRNYILIPIYLLKIRSGCDGGGKGALWQENKSATIACNNDQYMFVPIVADDILYIVRRLTPRECAKLQGFPADWHEGITNTKGKTLPDSAAYKGYGNAVATVCTEKPLAGIVEIINKSSKHHTVYSG